VGDEGIRWCWYALDGLGEIVLSVLDAEDLMRNLRGLKVRGSLDRWVCGEDQVAVLVVEHSQLKPTSHTTTDRAGNPYHHPPVGNHPHLVTL